MNLNEDNKDQHHDLPDTDVPVVDNARRKFNKAGAIAPVLLSLSSKPVWAANCHFSGPFSGNISHRCTPVLFTLADLQASPQIWPGNDSSFDAVFGTIPGRVSLFGSAILKNVISASAIPATDNQLRNAFSCTIGNNATMNSLRAALLNYAKLSIVAAVNATVYNSTGYTKYAYVAKPTFQSIFTALSSSQCSTRTTYLTQTAIPALKNIPLVLI